MRLKKLKDVVLFPVGMLGAVIVALIILTFFLCVWVFDKVTFNKPEYERKGGCGDDT